MRGGADTIRAWYYKKESRFDGVLFTKLFTEDKGWGICNKSWQIPINN